MISGVTKDILSGLVSLAPVTEELAYGNIINYAPVRLSHCVFSISASVESGTKQSLTLNHSLGTP